MELHQQANPVERSRSPNLSRYDRKRKRATRACLSCRARKVRCDVMESENACTNCRLDSLACVIKGRKQTRPTWNDGLRSYRRRQLSNGTPSSSGHDVMLNHAPESQSSTTADADGPDACDQAQPASPNQQAPEWRNLGDQLSGNADSQLHPTRPHVAASVLDQDGQARRPEDFHAKRECEAIDMHSSSSLRNQVDISDMPIVPGYIKPLPVMLSSDDRDYLLSKDALTIPTDPLRTRLLQGFIEYVYGYMPLLDLNELLQAIALEGKDSAPRISILLFQAVMFAGAAFVDMEHLRASGYRTRRAARQELFERVKLLYNFNVEKSDITLIQTLLLMTHWFHDHGSHKDLWCWMGIATTLSQASALHIDSEHQGLTLQEQRLRKRLGWCVFMRDQILALGMRRPAHIQLDRHTIPVMSLDDFECDPLYTTVLPPDCTVVRDPVQRRQLAALCIEKCKLCICISSLLSTQYRPVAKMLPGDDGPIVILVPRGNTWNTMAENQTDTCNKQLERWKRHLPIMCMYDSVSALSACESTVMVVHKALLKMMYLTVMAAMYRPHIMPFSPWSTKTSSLSKAATSLPATSKTKICSAASEISAIGHDLQNLGLVHYLPTSSVTVFLPALIVHLLRIAYASEEEVAESMPHFSSGMAILTSLSENYASAELAVHFLEATVDISNMKISRVARLLHRSPPPEHKSWPQRNRSPSISPVDPARGRKHSFCRVTPTVNGHHWPECSLWLEDGPLAPNVPDPRLDGLWAPQQNVSALSHAESGDVGPVSDEVDLSSEDMRGEVCPGFNRDVLEWESGLGEVQPPANCCTLVPEISSFLDNETFFASGVADLEGIGTMLFSPNNHL